MNIAVIGSGGREHAIAWKLEQSPQTEKVYVIPGNGGTKNNVSIDPNDFAGIKKFCEDNTVDLIFVGPEDPLAKGIVDFFGSSDIKIFGPDKEAAELEGSKIHSKKFMKKYGVATADFWLAENGDDIEQVIDEMDGNLVIKYDGLAAGKGVFVCSSEKEAYAALDEIKSRYGIEAPFIIEEKFTGLEISIIGFTDGKDIKLLMPSQDHKPAYDGDQGPNTGGMGAYCPLPFCDEKLLDRIKQDIVLPTLKGIQTEKMNYKGVIYFGIMMDGENPKLLEYNVRFGDPETEVILPALKTDLLDLILACLNGTLGAIDIQFNEGYFVDVVLASGGYPGSYEKGKEISGLNNLSSNALAFHAGTVLKDGKIVTSGGRVLNIVMEASSLEGAIQSVYKEVEKITFEKMFFRTDIGKKGLQS